MNVKKIAKKYLPIIAREIDSRRKYKAAATFLKEHPQSKLTIEEKKEIDNYWKKYNIKFPDYSWFEMYYGVTGIHDPRFIPDPILGRICYPYYNFASHIKGWDDKNVYEKLVPHATFPDSLCHCIKGTLYDCDWNSYNKDSIQQLANRITSELEGLKEIICKETVESSFGKGVKLLKIEDKGDLCVFLNNHPSKNYILQKRVIQHPFFCQFNPTSANIIRIITWRSEGTIKILSASIRFGMEGSFTDVAFVNGKEIVNVVGINQNGNVKDRFVSLEGNNDNPPKIKEKKVPSWDRLHETVKKAHEDLLFFDYVAWDFMIDENGNPICIEYNINWPGTILYQFANGPLAGDYTDQFLSFLKGLPTSEIPLVFRN